MVGQMIRLNVGSGQRPFKQPFINVDVNPKWRPDVVADGEHMPMFEDGSADVIVLHHVLEHFGCGEASVMIRECQRILCPGGSLLVFVPDMRKLLGMWNIGRLTTQVFMTNVYGAYMNSEADRHKWGYDKTSLVQFLTGTSKWAAWDEFNWRPIPGADIARDDSWILGVEVIK
jgi:SAM-dependent methyltransferase